jgi:ubiquitin-conjugating enzyme E2 D/E
MASALARIQREYAEILKEAPENVSAGPTSDGNLSHWEGVLIGPTGSPYEGGLFRLEIVFPEEYPFKPPAIQFKTPVYHPNIHRTGAICLDILKQSSWSPALTITKVLLSISSLLTDANPKDPLSPEVAEVYIRDRAQFDVTARAWTQKFAR